MKTTFATLVILAVGYGCHKTEESVQPARAPEAPPSTEPAAPPAAEKLKLDPSKIKGFAGYFDKYIDLMRDARATLGKLSDKSNARKDDGVVGAANMLNDHLTEGKKLSDRNNALLKEYNLTEAEAAGFNKVEAAIVVRASPIVQQMVTHIETLEKSMDKAPPDQRPAYEKSLAEMKATRDEQLSLKDVREEFGDTIVDAMLAEEATWLRLDKKLGQP